MTFDEALKIVRREYPNRLIWHGFEYFDKYVFTIAVGMKFLRRDLSLTCIAVDKLSGETEGFDTLSFLYGQASEDEYREYKKATNNIIYIDVNKEDIQ